MEDNQNTQVEGQATPETNKEEKEVAKTFSQEDMNNLAGKIRSEEKAKNEQAIKDAVNNAIAEYERKAKLTKEEREKEEKTKRENELIERENAITMRERSIEARELLVEKGLSTDLVGFVVDSNLEVMKERIAKLTETYNKSVEIAVQEKLKGTAPKDFSANDKPVAKTFSNVF